MQVGSSGTLYEASEVALIIWSSIAHLSRHLELELVHDRGRKTRTPPFFKNCAHYIIMAFWPLLGRFMQAELLSKMLENTG